MKVESLKKVDPKVAEWHRLYYEEGWTLQRIANAVNLTRQAIHFRFKRYNLPTRPASNETPEWKLELLEKLYLENFSNAFIGNTLDLSKPTVAKYIKRLKKRLLEQEKKKQKGSKKTRV